MAREPISFVDPEVQRCPFAAYAAVREQGPVYYDASCGYYIVTGYEEVRKWAADTVNLSNVTGLLLVKDAPYQPRIDAIYQEHGFLPVNTLTVSDPPLHDFHRSLVDQVFSASRVRQMEAYLQSIIDGLIDRFIDRGRCDFYREFASRVPLFVIADALGVKPDDVDQFRAWSEAVIQEGDPNNGEERQAALTYAICELQQFIARQAERYRQLPGDCLLSDLVHADDAGRRMSDRELVSMVVILIAAGIDSTALALASAMVRLIEQPERHELLRDRSELIPNFIEEVLRLEAPVQGLYRRVVNDITIAGVAIPRGATVVLRFGAANRDPAQFADPDALELDRRNARSHLAFGAGPHFCIGNQLSRGELRIAFSTLLKRMRSIRIAEGDRSVEWVSHFLVYGPYKLDIAFERI